MPPASRGLGRRGGARPGCPVQRPGLRWCQEVAPLCCRSPAARAASREKAEVPACHPSSLHFVCRKSKRAVCPSPDGFAALPLSLFCLSCSPLVLPGAAVFSLRALSSAGPHTWTCSLGLHGVPFSAVLVFQTLDK